MLRAALLLARKDLCLLFFRSGGMARLLLLGLLFVVLFNLGTEEGQAHAATMTATVFWISSLVCQIFLASALFREEERGGSRYGLLLCPFPLQFVLFGKALVCFIVLFTLQSLLALASLLFFGLPPAGPLLLPLLGFILVDAGCVCLSLLLASVTGGDAEAELVCSLLCLPLLLPLLFTGIRLGSAALGGPEEGLDEWLYLAAAFDAVFWGAALLLFPLIYGGEE